jgi:DNA-binding MarR family transcriptional regulator
MIDRMERKGWVLRVADPLDRRVNRLELTAEAHGIEAEMHLAATDLLEEALARLDVEERDLLADMLGRMKAELSMMTPRATAEPEPRLSAAPAP